MHVSLARRSYDRRLRKERPRITHADGPANASRTWRQNGAGASAICAARVSPDYDPESSRFTGAINWAQIDLGEDAEDADHLITPQERLRVAMARQ